MIDEIEFKLITDELVRRPLAICSSRRTCGIGRTQTFGLIRKRRTPHGPSAISRDRPFLYNLLLEFGRKHINHPFASITLNMNYRCEPHKDRGNEGESTVVGFGNYTGGELCVGENLFDVRHTPITMDFSSTTHWVGEFSGERYSMVFYNCELPDGFKVPALHVGCINGKDTLFVDGKPLIYNKHQRSKKYKKRAVKGATGIINKLISFGSRVLSSFRSRKFLKSSS